jgi:hypothetical protein
MEGLADLLLLDGEVALEGLFEGTLFIPDLGHARLA